MENPIEFIASNSNDIPWVESDLAPGVMVRTLCCANGQTMELYRFPPKTTYPDHYHEGPEFVYLMEGSARQNSMWLKPGWFSVGSTGSLDSAFTSGSTGCLFLTVYTASRYI